MHDYVDRIFVETTRVRLRNKFYQEIVMHQNFLQSKWILRIAQVIGSMAAPLPD